jgi:glyoxylase-like metal-dependent hydrolase (beta-lactamase superfamily II)
LKTIPVKGYRNVYTSNVYLITGEWKRIEDINTLIDVGNDPSIIDVISKLETGAGKKKVEQVILTHDHSDHTGILPLIIKEYNPAVYAYSPFIKGVTHILHDGELIRAGENYFEVIHTPGHSSDSICLYNEDDKVLFVGDTPVVVRGVNGDYDDEFVTALQRISQKMVKSIYFGHGEPITHNAHSLLIDSLNNISAQHNKG